jgi:hypothetical protein
VPTPPTPLRGLRPRPCLCSTLDDVSQFHFFGHQKAQVKDAPEQQHHHREEYRKLDRDRATLSKPSARACCRSKSLRRYVVALSWGGSPCALALWRCYANNPRGGNSSHQNFLGMSPLAPGAKVGLLHNSGNDAFYQGCTDLKVRLAPSDALRKSEPDYKRGWNAWNTSAQR